MRIVIIGGAGHVGTYLVPRLVHSGQEVLSISRGESKPFHRHPAWELVEQPRHPFGEYGTRKEQIEAYLLDEAQRHGFPATVLHPGHIVGTGWAPLNPAGNVDPEVFGSLARGEELAPHRPQP